MTVLTEPMTAERRAHIVPPAQHQLEPLPTDLLHSANAGVVVQKVGQLRSEYRDEGRMFAREMAKHVNARQNGNATTFVYEETFGYEDRLHFLIHLRDLTTYRRLLTLDAFAEQGRPGTFVDGSVHDDALTPHHWGLYATRQQQATASA